MSARAHPAERVFTGIYTEVNNTRHVIVHAPARALVLKALVSACHTHHNMYIYTRACTYDDDAATTLQ